MYGFICNDIIVRKSMKNSLFNCAWYKTGTALFVFMCFNLVLFNACKQKSLVDTPEAIITVEPSLSVKYKMDLVVDSRFVQLKSTEDFLVQGVSNLIVEDSLIFILDMMQNTVFMYDLNGNPVNKIHAVGGGPGEYTQLIDDFVDPIEHTINVFDFSTNKVLTYTYDGTFCKEMVPSKRHTCCVIKQPGTSYYVGEVRYPEVDKILYATKDTQLIGEAISVENRASYAPFLRGLRGNTFSVYKDTVYYLSLYDYSIYSFSNGTFRKEAVLSMDDNYKISSFEMKPDSQKTPWEEESMYLNRGIIAELSSLTVSENYYSFGFLVNGDFLHYNILYDRRTKESFFYENLYTEGERLFQPPFTYYNEGKHIYIIQSQKEIEYLFNAGLIEELDYDTPVICFVSIK